MGGVWFEADHYFWENGKYNFDAERLHCAHAWCMKGVQEAMSYGSHSIIVSNTFTRERELAPYLGVAELWGYKVTTLVVENRHGNTSVHNVPEETMTKMKDRFSIKL